MSVKDSKNLWGPIVIDDWQSTAATTDRVADEEDVKAGRAVFYIDGVSQHHEMPIPSLARWLSSEPPGEIVVIIQAEVMNQGVALGVRPLSGGNAVVMLEDVEVLNDDAAPP
ncbi:MAG: hypothetical protein AAGG45_01600 [Pseudomonadota bacterium]